MSFQASRIVAITPGATELATGGATGAVLCTADATARVIDALGNDISGVPLQKGYNPVRIRQLITLSTGNAFALF
ncbi:MAG: hypothetical protein ACK52I_37545 [Pseudomonadota bacterium]